MLAPFRGVRYAEGRVSGLAEVTSPPYDVIAPDKQNKLMASDPHNVARLIMPHPAGAAGDRYRDAACVLEAWLAEGILVPDPVPALYVYEQVTAGADGSPAGADGSPAGWAALLQRGLIGALRLVPLDAGIVLPHEDVAPGQVTGSRELMEATQANLEPIFLRYDGAITPGAAARIVEQAAACRRPLAQALTPDGLRHRLWAITDEAELAEVDAD